MLELEDNFVDGSFIITAHIGEGTCKMIVRSKVECAPENSDEANDIPKTTRKHRASNENEPQAALRAMDVRALFGDKTQTCLLYTSPSPRDS